MIVLVMGVSGSGKSTIGAALAAALGADFLEADSFHSPANIAKMKSGIPLEDADRWPWLDAIGGALDRSVMENRSVVLACSALKASYRERLLPIGRRQGRVVFLKGDAGLIGGRLSGRTGHYMPPALLPSQFATLEAPDEAIIIDIAQEPEEILEEILARLSR
ncbi:MAG: AAA family ATPase [Proteobacteria bacterium]|nr:AAA family ATPase [Pseudomonadota bacterium]